MARHPGFPFAPRSTAYVRPGDFWAIPTRRGGWYCCGLVLANEVLDVSPRRSLIVGLIDWCGPEPPTSENIAGCSVLEYGIAHVKTIRETGGVLLGHRQLETDAGLDALLGRRSLYDCSVWGYRFIEGVAHEHFGRHFPEQPPYASERPVPTVRGDR